MPGPVSTASRCSQPLVGPSHLDPSIGRAICAQAPLEAHPRGSTQPPFTPPHQGQKAPFRTKARDIPEGGNVQVRAEMRAVATTRTMGGPVSAGSGFESLMAHNRQVSGPPGVGPTSSARFGVPGPRRLTRPPTRVPPASPRPAPEVDLRASSAGSSTPVGHSARRGRLEAWKPTDSWSVLAPRGKCREQAPMPDWALSVRSGTGWVGTFHGRPGNFDAGARSRSSC
jgi:hypothetical protein